MAIEEDGNRSYFTWQRLPGGGVSVKETSQRGESMLRDIAITGVTIAKGIGYLARKGSHMARDAVARHGSDQNVPYPADKPGHASVIVLGMPSGESSYAPWKGSMSDRFHRAAGFISWALDGTKAPQRQELIDLHESEMIDQATRHLNFALLKRASEAVGADPYVTTNKFPLGTGRDMHLASHDGAVQLELEGLGSAGEYGTNYLSLVVYPGGIGGLVTPPDFFRVDDTGGTLVEQRPATLPEINLFLADLQG